MKNWVTHSFKEIEKMEKFLSDYKVPGGWTWTIKASWSMGDKIYILIHQWDAR